MDTLTHCIAGGLTPLLFQRAPKRTALVVFGMVAGELPDIDAFFGSGTAEGLMLVHRGITHALVFQPILMLAYVVPFFLYLLYRHERGMGKGFVRAENLSARCSESLMPEVRMPALGFMFVMALVAQYVHIFLDSMTTFGTRIFLPFSSHRVDFPGMFIIDFFLLVPLACLWGWALMETPSNEPFWSRKSRWIARMALGWLILYPLANLGINHTLIGIYAKEHGVAKEQVSLFTEPFTPFAWKKIVWTGEWCTMETVFPFAGEQSTVTATYRVPETSLLDEFANAVPLFATFREFAPTLVLTDIAEGPDSFGQKIYRFADVRYIISPQSPARALGVSSTSFGFEVKTLHRRVVAYRYLSRLEETNNTPWVAVSSRPLADTPPAHGVFRQES